MKNVIFTFIFLLCTLSLYGETMPFRQDLSEEVHERIQNSEIVIRNLNGIKDISLDSENIYAEKALSQIKELKPVYLAEVIYSIPVKPDSELMENLLQVLRDVNGWVGIPYYSERNDVWVDLYSSCELKETQVDVKENGISESICADLYMEPFGTISSSINIDWDTEGMFFCNTNTDNVTYHDFKCIKPGKMKSVIVVFQHEGRWILYGIGGVNAPKFPGLSSRIELSFMNRIKTFCSFVFNKISEN